ncbi:hypothetical protein NLI96_g9735 [Meripilus lineatus]|uniref:Uncharacterized protein n=1 Tax=Meripilus lineatus TaxID=2056292 RepID=A0AAD5YEY3_9APHY|nr:hypothetical protein NLI96_g9735 [Physisporinus lineatus]
MITGGTTPSLLATKSVGQLSRLSINYSRFSIPSLFTLSDYEPKDVTDYFPPYANMRYKNKNKFLEQRTFENLVFQSASFSVHECVSAETSEPNSQAWCDFPDLKRSVFANVIGLESVSLQSSKNPREGYTKPKPSPKRLLDVCWQDYGTTEQLYPTILTRRVIRHKAGIQDHVVTLVAGSNWLQRTGVVGMGIVTKTLNGGFLGLMPRGPGAPRSQDGSKGSSGPERPRQAPYAHYYYSPFAITHLLSSSQTISILSLLSSLPQATHSTSRTLQETLLKSRMSTVYADDIIPGDIVSVNHGTYGRREGLVVGSHTDYAGRQILEVQMEPGDIYHAWYPTVHRVRRTVSYQPALPKARTVQRTIYW